LQTLDESIIGREVEGWIAHRERSLMSMITLSAYVMRVIAMHLIKGNLLTFAI